MALMASCNSGRMASTAMQIVSRRMLLVSSERGFAVSSVVKTKTEDLPVHPVYFKLKEKQKEFQVDNGLSIHERTGAKGRLLYYTTIGLCVVALGMCVRNFLKLAYPPKN